MLLYNLNYVEALSYECTPVPDGIVLNKYYLEDCGACKRLAPVLEEIKSKLERADIPVKYREVECTECECEGITSFPTLEITKDKETTSKSIGFKDYKNISEWLMNNLKIDKSVFENRIDHETGVVKNLIARDFLSGFDGQWIILFYDRTNEPLRESFKELASLFKDKVNIAEVHSEESRTVTNRFNINEYPHVVAINHGISIPFTGQSNTEALAKFTEKLRKPAFESITYSKLKARAASLMQGEPMYTVLYKDFEVASHYFNDMAQQFKFKATIYKSNDPEMFEAAGFHPQEAEGEADHSKMVKLFVFKNGMFYPCPVPLDNTGEIVQWVFHTHFAHVTNISNETFYTVFHGIKPVILLLTENEKFISEFNKLSADRHLGSPYSNMIFATLDTAEYPLFKKQILNETKTPALVFFDPFTSTWYYEYKKLSKENFAKESMDLIEKYFSKKLDTYPPKKHRISGYMVGAIIVALALFAVKALSTQTKKDID